MYLPLSDAALHHGEAGISHILKVKMLDLQTSEHELKMGWHDDNQRDDDCVKIALVASPLRPRAVGALLTDSPSVAVSQGAVCPATHPHSSGKC